MVVKRINERKTLMCSWKPKEEFCGQIKLFQLSRKTIGKLRRVDNACAEIANADLFSQFNSLDLKESRYDITAD